MPKGKTLHFGSMGSYRKYLAYGHIHGVFTEKVQPKIVIAGKQHMVHHCEICKSRSHHTHAHHMHHPHDKDSMSKSHSRSKMMMKRKPSNPLSIGRVSIGNVKMPRVV